MKPEAGLSQKMDKARSWIEPEMDEAGSWIEPEMDEAGSWIEPENGLRRWIESDKGLSQKRDRDQKRMETENGFYLKLDCVRKRIG